MKGFTTYYYRRHILCSDEMTQVVPGRDNVEGLVVTGISKGDEITFIGFEGHKYLMISTVHGYDYGTMKMDRSKTPSAQDQYEMGFITEAAFEKYKDAKKEYDEYERERRERKELEYLKSKYEEA